MRELKTLSIQTSNYFTFPMASISLRKLNNILLRHPEIASGSSSEIEVVGAQLDAVTTGSSAVNCKIVISIPSAFGGRGIIPPRYPANAVMSVVPQDCKIVPKSYTLPKLVSLKLIEAENKGDPQVKAIKELVEAKHPDLERKVRAMGAYLGHPTHDIHVKEKTLWVVIPMPLRTAVVNRIHSFHHGRVNMFDAARDVLFPHVQRNLVAASDECQM